MWASVLGVGGVWKWSFRVSMLLLPNNKGLLSDSQSGGSSWGYT